MIKVLRLFMATVVGWDEKITQEYVGLHTSDNLQHVY